MTTTFAERAAAEKARIEALTPAQRAANADSHRIGNVDDCRRCIYCEVGSWNAWKQLCPAS